MIALTPPRSGAKKFGRGSPEGETFSKVSSSGRRRLFKNKKKEPGKPNPFVLEVYIRLGRLSAPRLAVLDERGCAPGELGDFGFRDLVVRAYGFTSVAELVGDER